MREVEDTYKDQDMWNNEIGMKALDDIQKNPDEFIVDPSDLSLPKANLIQMMSGIKGKKILEYGFGHGLFSVVLARSGGLVTGIDIGDNLVELAGKVIALNNVECKFIQGDISKLPFENETFDFVVGNAILHHLPKKGVIDSVSEAYRVLKPGGMALFTECIENSKFFDFLQNLIPLGAPSSLYHRPSILNRAKWKEHQKKAQDRALSNSEFMNAKGSFKEVEFKYYGLLSRLGRLYENPKFLSILEKIDLLLTHKYSPFKKLSRAIVVIYRK